MKQQTETKQPLESVIGDNAQECKHTPGIASIDDDGFVYVGSGEDYVTLADLDCNDRDIDEREANKERFIKCWNEYDTLKEQNKEMLESLKELLASYKMYVKQPEKSQYVIKSEAAINKATNKQ